MYDPTGKNARKYTLQLQNIIAKGSIKAQRYNEVNAEKAESIKTRREQEVWLNSQGHGFFRRRFIFTSDNALVDKVGEAAYAAGLEWRRREIDGALIVFMAITPTLFLAFMKAMGGLL